MHESSIGLNEEYRQAIYLPAVSNSPKAFEFTLSEAVLGGKQPIAKICSFIDKQDPATIMLISRRIMLKDFMHGRNAVWRSKIFPEKQ